MKKKLSFPVKLYRMLEHIERQERNYIMSWQPHGRCFRIHDKKRLEEELLHLFFSTNRYQTLRRNLNKWGFKQIQGIKNPDKGCYYHPMFLRSQYKLCESMKRSSAISDDDQLPFQEPKFHTMPPMPQICVKSMSSSSSVTFSHGSCSTSCGSYGSSRRKNDGEVDFESYNSSQQTHVSHEEKIGIDFDTQTLQQMNAFLSDDPRGNSSQRTHVNQDNPSYWNPLANEENIRIDFDTQTIQELKALLPDDPRGLCDVFD